MPPLFAHMYSHGQRVTLSFFVASAVSLLRHSPHMTSPSSVSLRMPTRRAHIAFQWNGTLHPSQTCMVPHSSPSPHTTHGRVSMGICGSCCDVDHTDGGLRNSVRPSSERKPLRKRVGRLARRGDHARLVLVVVRRLPVRGCEST